MPRSLKVLALSALLLLPATRILAQDSSSVAQLPKAMSPAELLELKSNISIATGLVRIGQANKDAHALLVAARILSGIGSGVALPQSTPAGGKPALYDIAAIVAEAKGYAGGNQSLLGELSAVDATGPQHNCYWAWECNNEYCDRYYICTTD